MDTVSVIIPAYNARATIAACVESVLAGDVKPLEVIVVDDYSTDDTAAIVGALAVRYPNVVKLIHLPRNAGPARARNVGAASAEGAYYFFVDSDTEMLADTLSNFLRRIPEADAVSGIYHPEPINDCAAARYKAYLIAYLFGRAGVFPYDVFIASSAGIRPDVFKAVGGFNEQMPWGMDVENEDFGHRIAARYRLLMDPSITVRHHFPRFGKFTRTYFSRVSLWMELFLQRRQFERSGATTMGTGLSTAAAAAATIMLPLVWLHSAFAVISGALFAWHVAGYAGYFGYVAKRRPSFLLSAFLLNFWFSLVLAAGAAYGVLRMVTGTGRVPVRMREPKG